MAVTAETRQDIIELVVTALDAAPGTTLLTELVGIVNSGGTLADVAAALAAKPEFTSTYPAFQTAEEFADEWLGNLIPEAGADALAEAKALVVGEINAGTSAASLLLQAQAFLSSASETDAAFGTSVANFNNRVEVATRHTITNEEADMDSVTLSQVTSDDATVTTANTSLDAEAPTAQFTLTNGTDTASAISFNAPRVYTPGGNDRVNSIQDEDNLTGVGDSASLTAVLGEPNDAAGATITPAMSNIKTVNTSFSASTTAMTLNLQDSVGVETVNVSRISGGQIATVDDMLGTTNALSVSNTNAQGEAHLLYQDSELDGTQSVTVTVDDVDMVRLTVGSTAATPTEGIETLTVKAEGSLSTLTELDNLADNVAATNQDINIEAAVDLTITGFADPGEISAITVSGAGDVTLGETGSRTTASQESSVDASALTGALTVDYQNLDAELDSSVTGGSGADVIENRDAVTTTWVGDILADIDGGAGNDTIHVDGDLTKTTERDGDDGDVSVAGGAGDDTIIVAGDVSENAAVTGGDGADTIQIGGTINAMTGTAADGDVQGTVDAGAGDDTINIVHREIGANAYENSGAAGITGVAGSLVGGDGADTLNYNSNETATTVATSSAANAARISGIETINLNSNQSYDATIVTNLGNAGLTVVANDLDATTADFTFDLGEATDAVNINMNNQATVTSATSAASVVTYMPGDNATYTLTNVSSDHVLTVTADETVVAQGRGGATISATAYATAVAADVAADATLNLTLAATASQTQAANTARTDAITVTLEGSGDFAINDNGTGVTTNNDIDSLTVTTNGTAAQTIALGANDFETSLTLNGSSTSAVAVTQVEAATVDASALTGGVTVTLADSENKTITMGSGNDHVDAQLDTVNRDDTIDFGDGTDSLTVDVLASAGDITNSNDEYFENMTSLENLNLTGGADVVLDDDAQATGIVKVDVDNGSSTLSVQSDYSNALTITMDVGSTTVLDNDANVNIDLTIDEQLAGTDTTVTLTDAGTGTVNITAKVDDIATNVTSANTGNDIIITAAAGSIDQITLQDSTALTVANTSPTGAITVTAAAAWAGAGETIIFDLTDINDDDNDANGDGDTTDNGDINDTQTVTFTAAAVGAGDYAVDYRGSGLVDTFTGSAQADTVTLGAGGDTYNSTAGADTITGGAGADNFVFSTIAHSSGGTVDTITDFDTGSDTITLTFTTPAATTVDLSGFASNRASLADSLSTLDGNAGDHFYASNGQIAVDVNGDGNISDGIDWVIDVAGDAVASSDLRFVVTVGTGSSITGSPTGDNITLATGGNEVNTVVFAASAAANGTDTITGVEAGTSATDGEILDFTAFVSGRLMDAGGAANTGTTAVTEYSTAATGEEDINDKIVVFDNGGTALTATTLAAEFADGTGGGTTASFQDTNAAIKAVIIEGNAAGGAGGVIWYVDSSLDGTAADVTAADVKVVGTLATNIDIDAMTGNQFS